MVLTNKQSMFIAAYLADPNAKRAAISAGYSEATAAQAGSRLLRHPSVVKAIGKPKIVVSEKPKAPNASDAFVPNLLAARGEEKSPLAYMLEVMNDPNADEARRDKMAVASAPYLHIKKGEGGKKDEQGLAAKRASGGKFSPSAPPKLVVSNR